MQPDDVAGHAFGTTFRGFDPAAVREFLVRVGDEMARLRAEADELRERVAALESAPRPPMDEAALTAALGDEAGHVLRAAHEAAAEVRARAETQVARLIREAQDEAEALLASARNVLAERRAEAEADVADTLTAAGEEAARIRAEALSGVETDAAASTESARVTVAEAQELRERLLGDLARRRRAAHVQLEQLRAGRERLVSAYDVVRGTLEEVTRELDVAEEEARAAAELAGARAERAPDEGVDALRSHLDAQRAMAERDVVVDAEVVASAPNAALAPEPEPAPEGEQVATVARLDLRRTAPAPPERPSGSVRVLRPVSPPSEPSQPTGPPDADLVVVEPSALFEGVRIVGPATAGSGPEPTPAHGEQRAPSAEEVFARLRADRAEAVAKAQVVLAGDEVETPAPEPDDEPEADPDDAAVVAPSDDEALLERRDRLVEGALTALVKRLKRALQDEQNVVLDRLRSHPGRLDVDALLGPEAERASAFSAAAALQLVEAARAGAGFAGGDESRAVRAPVDALSDALGRALAEGLRLRMMRAMPEGIAAELDQGEVAERVGAVYREWKSQRLDGLAGDHVTAAFAAAAYAATPDGVPLRWVVDDEGGPCPDCDDDALAGPTARGERFPTGQLHPPAHAGCRCVLATVPS